MACISWRWLALSDTGRRWLARALHGTGGAICTPKAALRGPVATRVLRCPEIDLRKQLGASSVRQTLGVAFLLAPPGSPSSLPFRTLNTSPTAVGAGSQPGRDQDPGGVGRNLWAQSEETEDHVVGGWGGQGWLRGLCPPLALPRPRAALMMVPSGHGGGRPRLAAPLEQSRTTHSGLCGPG